jgi:hypothetical protein
VLADRYANRIKIMRVAQCLAELDQPLELIGAVLSLARRFLRRFRLRLHLMAPAQLMKKIGASQKKQRRQEREAALPLDLARVIEQARNRRRKDDDQRRRQRGDQEEILAANEFHEVNC